MTISLTSLLAGAASIGLAKVAAKAADAPLVQADDPCFVEGQALLEDTLAAQPNTNPAKNVILFVGDGMGLSTVTATRIFEGQQRGGDGVSNQLAFDAFPHSRCRRPIPATARSPNSAPTPRP